MIKMGIISQKKKTEILNRLNAHYVSNLVGCILRRGHQADFNQKCKIRV